jgi:hypothetical protein
VHKVVWAWLRKIGASTGLDNATKLLKAAESDDAIKGYIQQNLPPGSSLIGHGDNGNLLRNVRITRPIGQGLEEATRAAMIAEMEDEISDFKEVLAGLAALPEKSVVEEAQRGQQYLSAWGIDRDEMTVAGVNQRCEDMDDDMSIADLGLTIEAARTVEAVTAEEEAEFTRLETLEEELCKDMPGRITAKTPSRACNCGATALKRITDAGDDEDKIKSHKACAVDTCACRRAGDPCGPLCLCFKNCNCQNVFTLAVRRRREYAANPVGEAPPDVTILDQLAVGKNYQALDWCHTIFMLAKQPDAGMFDQSTTDVKCQVPPEDRGWEEMVSGQQEQWKDAWYGALFGVCVSVSLPSSSTSPIACATVS